MSAAKSTISRSMTTGFPGFLMSTKISLEVGWPHKCEFGYALGLKDFFN